MKENICMTNKLESLLNLSNFQSSEMWATGLKSATMTIRADKFCFNDNFYVSVVVLPNNDECHRHRRAGDECHLDYGKIVFE